MRSPTAKRILSKTSEQQKQEVKDYANKLILQNKFYCEYQKEPCSNQCNYCKL